MQRQVVHPLLDTLFSPVHIHNNVLASFPGPPPKLSVQLSVVLAKLRSVLQMIDGRLVAGGLGMRLTGWAGGLGMRLTVSCFCLSLGHMDCTGLEWAG